MITAISQDKVIFELKYDSIGYVPNAEGLQVITNALWIRVKDGKWGVCKEKSIMKIKTLIENNDSKVIKTSFSLE